MAGCTDALACNYNIDATDDNGSCDYARAGCTDADACNYDPMHLSMTNRVITAAMLDARTHPLVTTIQTSSKTMDHANTFCVGCTDVGAAITIRFSRWKMVHAIIAAWAAPTMRHAITMLQLQAMTALAHTRKYYDCDGNCLMDMDGDGVCDVLEIAGCTDEAPATTT